MSRYVLSPALLLALSGAAYAAEQAPDAQATEHTAFKDGRSGGGGGSTAGRPAGQAPASRPAAPAAPAQAAPAARPAAPAAPVQAAPAARPAAPAAPAQASRPAAPAPAAPAARPSAPTAPVQAAPAARPTAPSAPAQAAPATRPAGAPAASSSNPWQVGAPKAASAPGTPAAMRSSTAGATQRVPTYTSSRPSYNAAPAARPASTTAPAPTRMAPTNPSARPATYTGGSRAQAPARPAQPARPPAARPARPAPPPHAHAAYHPRPYAPPARWYHARYPAYHPARPVHWYHGVFVYGPPPVQHTYYVVDGGSTATVAAPAPELPKRKVDRTNSFAVGVRGGSYYSGYDDGGSFSDAGIGLNVRYRPVEAVGFEMAYTYYNDTFDGDNERATSALQPSVQVFAAPWSRFSPYVTAGATFVRRDYNDTWMLGNTPQHTSLQDNAWGPHAGLGLELALGESAAVDIEGRYVGLVNVGGDDPSFPGALQGTAGVNFYF